jgi:hypothetical protein
LVQRILADFEGIGVVGGTWCDNVVVERLRRSVKMAA